MLQVFSPLEAVLALKLLDAGTALLVNTQVAKGGEAFAANVASILTGILYTAMISLQGYNCIGLKYFLLSQCYKSF